MFPFDDVIMDMLCWRAVQTNAILWHLAHGICIASFVCMNRLRANHCRNNNYIVAFSTFCRYNMNSVLLNFQSIYISTSNIENWIKYRDFSHSIWIKYIVSYLHQAYMKKNDLNLKLKKQKIKKLISVIKYNEQVGCSFHMVLLQRELSKPKPLPIYLSYRLHKGKQPMKTSIWGPGSNMHRESTEWAVQQWGWTREVDLTSADEANMDDL